MTPRNATVLVVGESLIDAVDSGAGSVVEHVGGSPANVAFGLGALDHPVELATHLGRDDRGARIAALCAHHGVRLTPGSDGAAHTSVAHATLDERGRASYLFDLTWLPPDPTNVDHVGHVHTGSIASTLAPGADRVRDIVVRLDPQATISYDPNIRPALMGSPEQVRDRVEQLVGLSDVVKASDEDLAWLYPGSPPDDVVRVWLALGPGLVVITQGAQGAGYAVRSAPDAPLAAVRPRATQVVDTVGAGDSFMAGLLSGLLDAGLLGSPQAREQLARAGTEQVRGAVERAIATSGATVSRAGAYAPSRREIGV